MLRDVNKTESVPRPDYAQVKGHIFIVQIKNRTQAYYLGMLESHHVARIKLTIIFIDTILLPMMFVYRFLEKHWLGMDTKQKHSIQTTYTIFKRDTIFLSSVNFIFFQCSVPNIQNSRKCQHQSYQLFIEESRYSRLD